MIGITRKSLHLTALLFVLMRQYNAALTAIHIAFVQIRVMYSGKLFLVGSLQIYAHQAYAHRGNRRQLTLVRFPDSGASGHQQGCDKNHRTTNQGCGSSDLAKQQISQNSHNR